MAFFGDSFAADIEAKANVARYTAILGKRSIAFPATSSGTEYDVQLDGCGGCAKLAAHNPCSNIGHRPLHGGSRYTGIPAANILRIEDANRLQAMLFVAGMIGHGYIGDATLYNAGWGGDNASQFKVYEVVSVSGTTLTIKGPNPKRLVIGRLRVNPEWPFPDPITGESSRLISETQEQVMPIGAQVEFEYPSCLFPAGKVRPLVKSISPPVSDDADDVTFSVTLTASASNAMSPIDTAFPPPDGIYKCRIRFEALYPSTWLNFQPTSDTAWTRRIVTINTAAIHRLKTSTGGDTRILYPGWFDGAFTVTQFNQDGTASVWSNSYASGRTVTVQTGAGAWYTNFIVDDLDFANVISTLVVRYHPQAVSGDTYRVWMQGRCSNAQTDPSGSYSHSGGQLCSRVASTQFATFQAGCWQPHCDGFALGTQQSGQGNMLFPPHSLGLENWWGSLWHRANWILVQGMEGISSYRVFSYQKLAGPSLGSLLGSWRRNVSGTYVPLKEELASPAFGKRVTWDDETGNQYHGLIYGAYFLAPYNFADRGGPVHTWSAGTTPTAGLLPETVSGWGTKDSAIGGNLPAEMARFPERGSGRINCYTYGHSGTSLGKSNERWATADAYLTGMDLRTVDGAVSNIISARFGS